MRPQHLMLFGCLAFSTYTYADDAERMAARIAEQQQAVDRHIWDARRDPARRPYELFQFLGLKEGMVTLDVGAFAGYTTEMLAAAVGETGKVYSHNTEKVLKTFADGYYERTMTERLADDRLPNVEMHIRDYGQIGLDMQIDFAVLGNLLHDLYNDEGEDGAIELLESIYGSLKPGGILGVFDHVGIRGCDNAKLHRIPPETARKLLLHAGFVIEAESDLYSNVHDDHTLMVYNEAIYLQTDRFLFRARRPLK